MELAIPGKFRWVYNNFMHISEINIYPIKSLSRISLESAKISDRGLEHDRRWMLINRESNFLSQRTYPKMATIQVEIAPDGLVVSESSAGKLSIPFEPVKPRVVRSTIWRNRCRTLAYEDSVNEWFSDVLGGDVRLVRMPDSTKRLANHPYKIHPDDAVSLADGYPFLVISEGSLADLNSRLAEPVPMTRFRPNFVVTGTGPFEEDTWRKLNIGKNAFWGVKLCGRCKITMVDQQTGKQGLEPLATLASYRTFKQGRKQLVMFGQNLIAERTGGVVRVGDAIKVMETSS